jgi:hypothetical protein
MGLGLGAGAAGARRVIDGRCTPAALALSEQSPGSPIRGCAAGGHRPADGRRPDHRGSGRPGRRRRPAPTGGEDELRQAVHARPHIRLIGRTVVREPDGPVRRSHQTSTRRRRRGRRRGCVESRGRSASWSTRRTGSAGWTSACQTPAASRSCRASGEPNRMSRRSCPRADRTATAVSTPRPLDSGLREEGAEAQPAGRTTSGPRGTPRRSSCRRSHPEIRESHASRRRRPRHSGPRRTRAALNPRFSCRRADI